MVNEASSFVFPLQTLSASTNLSIIQLGTEDTISRSFHKRTNNAKDCI